MEQIDKTSNCFYPLYIDANFSREAGRASKKEHSPAAPTIQELVEAMSLTNIPFQVEPYKRHPIDFFRFGRIRYKLADQSGKLYNQEIKSKSELANRLGQTILLKAKAAKPTEAQKQGKGKRN